MDVRIESSWKDVLKEEFNQPYFHQIPTHIKTEKAQGKIIFPPGSLIFNAFNSTPFDKLKVVILGQDPYPLEKVRLMVFAFPYKKACPRPHPL